MSTLANPQCRATCLDRLARLTTTSERQWGRMTTHQMVCHLNDSFAVGAGSRHASPAKNLLTTTVVKWIALRTPIQWGKGFSTRPEIDQAVGGTPPADWGRDVAQLRSWIGEFGDRQTFGEHPIFGKMSQRDWHTWGFRHVDHHFRQFGV